MCTCMCVCVCVSVFFYLMRVTCDFTCGWIRSLSQKTISWKLAIWKKRKIKDLVKHNLETNHNFHLKHSRMLVYINKKCLGIFELRIIFNHNTIKQRTVFFSLSPYLIRNQGGSSGVMVIFVGNGHSDTSSNPGWGWLHFTWYKYTWERYESNYSPFSYW